MAKAWSASFSLTLSKSASSWPGELGWLTSWTVSRVGPFVAAGVRTPEGVRESSVSLSDMVETLSDEATGVGRCTLILGGSVSVRRRDATGLWS